MELERLLFVIASEAVVLSENGENPSLVLWVPIRTIKSSAFVMDIIFKWV